MQSCSRPLLTAIARPQHGLMMMTLKPTPVPVEEAFAAIKAGIDALPPGTKMFLNSSERLLLISSVAQTHARHLQASSMDRA
jgi:hypothetical protein